MARMDKHRRSTPAISPEQFDEIHENGTVTISDGNGRTIHLADVEKMLTGTSATRAFIVGFFLLFSTMVVAAWNLRGTLDNRLRCFDDSVRDLEHAISGLENTMDVRMSDRWWGAAEALSETKKLSKNPEYAKFYLSPTEISAIQGIVKERIRKESL